MRLFNRIKKSIYAVAVIGALGATALNTADVSAATIINQPTQNRKVTVEVGDNVSTYNYVSNLKINGKSASKMKKSVKTVQTRNDVDHWTNYGTTKSYTTTEFNPDWEDTNQANDNNKYIAAGLYDFTFLKTGKYKISYDTYEYQSGKYNEDGDTYVNGGKREVSPDGKTVTTTYELKKTHHEDTYNVVVTNDPIKAITLGKNKVTATYKSNGTKYDYKLTYKNRYLKGTSGKLSIKTNKNYKITSVYVVTYDAEGAPVYTASGNNQTVTYGANNAVYQKLAVKYDLDANGKTVTLKDAAGADLKDENGDPILSQQLVTTSKNTSTFKPTEIHYGYQDTFTGDYTTYSVGTKQVYVKHTNDRGDVVYQKDANGDADTSKPVIDTVTATVLTKKFPKQTRVDGAWKTIEVVTETVYLPGAPNGSNPYKNSTYYLNPECKNYSTSPDDDDDYATSAARYSGEEYYVSEDGVSKYTEYTYTTATGDVRYALYRNPAYARKFYRNSNVGSWQVVTDGSIYSIYNDFTIDPTTGAKTVTTLYKWVDTEDAFGNKTPLVNTNVVNLNGKADSRTFNMK